MCHSKKNTQEKIQYLKQLNTATFELLLPKNNKHY